jgi:hypothetical protein
MNPQFPVRYQPPYSGMEQHVPQMQPHQAPHIQVPASTGGGASGINPGADPYLQEGDTSQQAPPPQQQQHQMPYGYGVPLPAGYYGAGMAMHPRGPGYPPQFVGGPQVQGGPPFRPMYPMQPGGIPPNMHIRGPGGTPYYPGPNGPIPYPPGAYVGHGGGGGGMMDDSDPSFMGRGGRGPVGGGGTGRGRARRGGRAGGRGGPNGGTGGRGNYPPYNNNNNVPPHGGGRGSPPHHLAPPAGVESSSPPTIVGDGQNAPPSESG